MRWAGANCPNVAALLGFNIWITAAMSNITAVADFVLASEDGLGMPGKRGISSDFDPLYKLPLLDNAGGSRLIEKINMSSCNVLTTQREYVLSTQELDIDFLQPCDHEEADTRVFLHLKHAVLQGHKVVFIRTVDTDLVVLAISVFDSLKELGLSELYIRYGVGKQRRDIPIQDVCYQLGP